MRRCALPLSSTAGEADGPESIKAAVRFGAVRIGHGVRAREDEGVLKLLRERQIPLELCPTSNVQTKAVKSFCEHPILDYFRQGLKATVNTDNMTISDTMIDHEYSLLKEKLGMTLEEHRQLLLNAADATFLTAGERGRMKDVICRILGKRRI